MFVNLAEAKENFIKKAKKTHGDKYDYSLVDYKGSQIKVKIICPIHGIFEQTPNSHSQKSGCPFCKKEKVKHNKSFLTTEEFINKARKIHGDKYDYSLVVYKGNKEKIKIICPIHGVFEQTPSNHLKGVNCPKCGHNSLTTEEFINKAKKVHGDNYDYSNIIYVDTKHNVMNIKCCTCGQYFNQKPNNHLNGSGCPKCNTRKLQTNSVIKRLTTIYPNINFSNIDYQGSDKLIECICNKHGSFKARANDLLMGKYVYGCPKCSINGKSVIEKSLVSWLKTISCDLIENDRTVLEGKELDIYFPYKKVAIEFDGLYWHSTRFKDKAFHLEKTIECEKQGIRLIHIFEDEWLKHPEIVKSIICSALGYYQKRIFARKCEIKELNSKEFDDFCEQNHIQGKCPSSKRFGLFYNNELVQIVGFSKPRFTKKYRWELTRMCTKLNTQVVGGFSKLMKHFGQTCISYIDRRLFDGKGYYSSNFQFIKYNKPQYFYIKGQQRFYRMNFQKKLLKNKLNLFDPSLTEEQNMKNNGYYKIYDCGTVVVVYNIKRGI